VKNQFKELEFRKKDLQTLSNQVEETFMRMQSHISELQNKIRKKDVKIGELNQRLLEENNIHLFRNNDLEKQFKTISKDLQTSYVRNRYLENTIINLTKEYDNTLKRFNNLKLHAKRAENIMARMQTREHQMVLVIKQLEKSRLDAENTLQDQDAEMKKYISRFSDLTYTIENMEQIIKYLSDHLKHSEKQTKILKKI